MTHPSPKRNMVPKAVLMRSGLLSLTTTRRVNTAQPKTTVNSARPMTNRVNTVSGENVNIAKPKAVVNAARLMLLRETRQIQVSNGLGPQKKLIFLSNVQGNPQMDLQDHGVIDSGCSRHMTGNMSYLTDFEEIDRGYVAFRGNPKGGKIKGRGTIKTGNLDFENVYFVRELQFNLFGVSQMCDKKNSVLFNDTKCIVLSPNFKLTDESHVLLKVPRKNNMYSVDLKNIVPKGGLTCLFAKATSDESKLWHRRLGHINFKTMNKLVKGNLVRGLPSKLFENDQTCFACQKGKQHRASYKSKTVSLICQPLHMLHMDLFGPTFVKSLMKKMYCLVVTDDYSRFSWVFFLATKDETSGILKSFITGVENLIDQRVKVIRCDNGTEFKNKEMNQFCERKGIKREFSVARTPQQNGVAERKNRTLIEAARTMLADSKLPTTFWAEAVNTACYVQNRVLVTKPHNKTPYELFLGRKPALGFMRPFGYLVTILNTIDHLGKFDGKADEGFFVGYSINSKAFRVFNSRTRIVEKNLHVQFSENTPNIAGSKARMEIVPGKDYILLPLWPDDPPFSQSSKSSPDVGFKPSGDDEKKEDNVNNTNNVNVASTNEVNVIGAKTSIELLDDPNMHELEDIIYSDDDENIGAEADMNNLNAFMPDETSGILKSFITGVEKLIDQRVKVINKEDERDDQEKDANVNSTNTVNAASTNKVNAVGGKTSIELPNDLNMPELEDIVYSDNDEDVGAEADMHNWIAFRPFTAKNKPNDFQNCMLLALLSHEETQKSKSMFVATTRFEDPDFPDRVYKVKSTLWTASSSQNWTKDFVQGCIRSISQDKYVTEILKKFGFTDVKTTSTPMETQKLLFKDEDGEEVDVHLYRSMIGSLMYLTSSRPDIMFANGIGVNAGDSKLMLLSVINLLLLGKVNAARHKLTARRGKDKCCLCINLRPEKKLIQMVKIHTDKNVADLLTKAFDNGIGVNAGDSKLMLLGINLLLLRKVNAARHKLTTVVEMDGKKIIVTEASVRRDLQLNDEEGMDCLPNATIFEELIRIGYEKLSQKLTFYKAFFSPQWKFLIHTILQCLSAKTTAWNEFSTTMASAIICLATNQKFNFSKYIFESMVKNLDNVGKFLMYLRVGKGFSGRDTPVFPTMMVQAQQEQGEDEAVYEERDDNLERDATTATGLDIDHNKGNINKTQSKATPNEPSSLGTRVNTPRSNEDRLKLNELMKLSTKLQQRVLDLENTKTAQAQEITSLKLREDSFKQGRKIDDIDKDTEITLVHKTQGRYGDEEMFDTDVLDGDEVLAEPEVTEKSNVIEEPSESITTPPTLTTTTATTTITATSTRPKAKGLVIHKQEQAPTLIVSSQQPSQAKIQDNGKAKMIKPEPVKNLEDLETLWKLVKVKHGSTRPEGGYERVLWGDLKIIFDPHVEDQIWRNQQDYRVLDWKLYDSCGVHSLRKQNVHIHMLVEKRYPFTPATITYILNRKLQADH
ncbi:putative ribonuclease H-like domain-containing protein [Tanacetum coccineum]